MYRATLPGRVTAYVTTTAQGDFSRHPIAHRCASVHQVHGNRVIAVDVSTSGACGDGDALISAADDVILAVRGADCPLIGLSSQEGIFAAVHSGWRGLVAGVIEASAAKMRAVGATEIFAVIGPFVGAECYEFSPADLLSVTDHFGEIVRSTTTDGGSALDLRACVDVAFSRAEIATSAVLGSCTSCSTEFYSWRARRDQERHALLISKNDRLFEAELFEVAVVSAYFADDPDHLGDDHRDRHRDEDFLDEQYLDDVRERLARLKERIISAGGTDEVGIVAVTKTFGLRACSAALSLGLSDLGENYANDLVQKATALSSLPADLSALSPKWHFLGGIQRNKLARLAPFVAVYESVDRLEEGIAIARHAPSATVLIEVRAEESDTKGGVAPRDVAKLAEQLSGLGLIVQGLMTVAPQDDKLGARAAFRVVRGLVDQLGLKTASMGMTDDLEVAVEEGSNLVRVGRALFGPRSTP